MVRLWTLGLEDIWKKFKLGVLALIGLMLVTSLMEGLGMALLVPLLGMIGVGNPNQVHMIRVFQDVFTAFSVPLNLLSVLLFILLISALQASTFVAQSWLCSHLQDSYMAVWRQGLFARCTDAGWSFFVKQRAGELVNTIVSEPDRLGGAFHFSTQLLSTIILLTVYTALAFYVSWQVTLLVFFIAIVMFLLTHQHTFSSYNLGAEISASRSALHAMCHEFIAGAKLLKATSTEKQAQARFQEFNEILRQAHFKGTFHPSVLKASFEFMSMAALCIVLAIGTQRLGVSSAELLVLLAVFVRLAPKMFSLQQNVQLLGLYLPSIDVVNKVLAEAERHKESLQPVHESVPVFYQGVAIAIDNLSFSYGDRMVLDRVNMDIPKGKTVGIVGGSGAGKSTLVDCLLRLNEPPPESIWVHNVPLERYSVSEWRRCVGYVAQETFLFHDTIRNNIFWGAFRCKDEDLIEASRRAGIHEFVRDLPRGYETVVGDRGVCLSGGQKQRIGLARALINHPPLLILDEPTSALDPESEEYVLQAIRSLRGQMTIVLISHRLSTVKTADVIYVLEEGRVVEHGSSAELITGNRRFSALLRLQQGSG